MGQLYIYQKPVNITSKNIDEYFGVSYFEYTFRDSAGTGDFYATNIGKRNTVAALELIAKRPMKVHFQFRCVSEKQGTQKNGDTFSVYQYTNYPGTGSLTSQYIVDNFSGNGGGSYPVFLKPGLGLLFQYSKDGSVNVSDEECFIYQILVSGVVPVQRIYRGNDDNKAEEISEALFQEDKQASQIFFHSSSGFLYNREYDITRIGACTDKKIIIPKMRNSTQITHIYEGALAGDCSELVIGENITYISSAAIILCPNLRKITIPYVGHRYNNSANSSQLFNYIFSKDSYTGSVRTQQFYESGLYSIRYLPANLEEIVVLNSYLKYGALQNINTVKKIVLKNTKNIGPWSLSGNDKLACVHIYGIPGVPLDIGEAAFAGCSSLTEIRLPETLRYISSYAFYECTSLQDIEIPGSVTLIDNYAFSWCTSLRKIKLPKSLTSLGTQVFQECPLKTIWVPKSLTYVGTNVFGSEPSLSTVYFEGTETEWKNGPLYGRIGNATVIYNTPY